MAAAVPFALKAAPWIASGVGALFGKKTSGPSKGQQAANTGLQQSGQQVGGMVDPLMRQGMQSVTPAAQYYQQILGSRQAATNAMAPETTSALEYYRGAEGKTRRTMQGGARDMALAELDRQRVGQIAGFLPAARRDAAEGASRLGTALTGQGLNAASTNAYIQSGLFDQGTKIRDQEGEGGKAWGKILFDIANSMPWGGKGKAPIPSSRVPQYPGVYTGPSVTPSRTSF